MKLRQLCILMAALLTVLMLSLPSSAFSRDEVLRLDPEIKNGGAGLLLVLVVGVVAALALPGRRAAKKEKRLRHRVYVVTHGASHHHSRGSHSATHSHAHRSHGDTHSHSRGSRSRSYSSARSGR